MFCEYTEIIFDYNIILFAMVFLGLMSLEFTLKLKLTNLVVSISIKTHYKSLTNKCVICWCHYKFSLFPSTIYTLSQDLNIIYLFVWYMFHLSVSSLYVYCEFRAK